MRSTLSSSLHEEVSASSVAPSSAEIIAKRIEELRAELVQVNAKLSSLAESFGKAHAESHKKSIKKYAMQYQRRKRAIEKRLQELEARAFNNDQLTFALAPSEPVKPAPVATIEPSSLALCVVVGSDEEFDTEILLPEMNAVIDLLVNPEIPRGEDDYAKEIAELDELVSTSTVSLDGIVADFDESVFDEAKV